MVSLAPSADMEPEAGEPEETTLESEMFLKSDGDKEEVKVLQEPIVELQRMNITGEEDEKEPVEDKEDEEGSEKKDEMENEEAEEVKFAENLSNMSTDANPSSGDPTDDPIPSNTHISPPKTNESDPEDIRKLTKTPSFGKTVRFKEIEAVEERDRSDDSLFPDFNNEEWTSTSFEELYQADDWRDVTGMFMKQIKHPSHLNRYQEIIGNTPKPVSSLHSISVSSLNAKKSIFTVMPWIIEPY